MVVVRGAMVCVSGRIGRLGKTALVLRPPAPSLRPRIDLAAWPFSVRSLFLYMCSSPDATVTKLPRCCPQ